MDDVWIEFRSQHSTEAVKLHGLWAESANAQAPVLLYLHGARWDVRGSAHRIRRMQELGFSVLGIDYRGFGRSSSELPSENLAVEDARAAWAWLQHRFPDRQRYIFGHSLGGAIAVHLAADVDDERGLIVEGSFTSIPDVVESYRWVGCPAALDHTAIRRRAAHRSGSLARAGGPRQRRPHHCADLGPSFV